LAVSGISWVDKVLMVHSVRSAHGCSL